MSLYRWSKTDHAACCPFQTTGARYQNPDSNINPNRIVTFDDLGQVFENVPVESSADQIFVLAADAPTG